MRDAPQASMLDPDNDLYCRGVEALPFWPECLHIKFPNICLCKAIFYIFKIRFRKIKICNVIIYLQQIKSPEFIHVISWVVQKACACGGASPEKFALVMQSLAFLTQDFLHFF